MRVSIFCTGDKDDGRLSWRGGNIFVPGFPDALYWLIPTETPAVEPPPSKSVMLLAFDNAFADVPEVGLLLWNSEDSLRRCVVAPEDGLPERGC